ncbi:MAG: O-antigen ligase family protein [Patescibacteria group bacterium]
MILEKALRFLVIGAIFLLTIVPFIVADTMFFPFITGKNFTFRIIVEIMAGGWITLALLNPQYRPRRSWILTAFTVFVLIIGLADALGAYPFKSFWSNFERMDGWVTLAHLLVYLFVVASVMTTEVLWRRLFYVTLALSACVSVYGFSQILGISAIGNNSASGLTARIDATFGNPIYLAVYMLFHVFLALWLWSRVWEECGPERRLLPSILFASVIVLDTLILFFTGTRGTMLGLLGGSILTALLLVVFARTTPLAWRIAVGYIAIIIIVAGGFWMVRDAAWVERVGFLNRLATISSSENGVKARFINWSIAWKGIQERPILGWGQENFALVFDKYYDPRMYAQEPWFDRVHNIVFDWLIAGGFLGLFSYLSIFVATLWALWRRGFSIVERSIFTGLLAGYFFHNFFVFDNISSYILFTTVLGYIAWRSSVASAEPPLWQSTIPRSAGVAVAVVAVLAVCSAIYGINAAALTQNKMLIRSMVPQAEGIEKNLELIKLTVDKGAFGTQEAREQLAQMASRIAGASDVSPAHKQAFYDLAVSEMKKQQQASPLDARFPLFLGIIYNSFGNYVAGAEALQQAHEISLQKQSILYEVAMNARARGDMAGALRALKAAYDLETANVQARIQYAAALILTGKNVEADQLLAPIIATGEAADPRIASAYLAGKQYGKIAGVWEGYVQAHPSDAQGYFTLAAAYYGMGDRPKAITVLEKASLISAEAATQAADFIQQIRNGTVQL